MKRVSKIFHGGGSSQKHKGPGRGAIAVGEESAAMALVDREEGDTHAMTDLSGRSHSNTNGGQHPKKSKGLKKIAQKMNILGKKSSTHSSSNKRQSTSEVTDLVDMELLDPPAAQLAPLDALKDSHRGGEEGDPEEELSRRLSERLSNHTTSHTTSTAATTSHSNRTSLMNRRSFSHPNLSAVDTEDLLATPKQPKMATVAKATNIVLNSPAPATTTSSTASALVKSPVTKLAPSMRDVSRRRVSGEDSNSSINYKEQETTTSTPHTPKTPRTSTTKQKKKTSRRRASVAGDGRDTTTTTKSRTTPIETETDSIPPLHVEELLLSPTKLVINSATHGTIETTMTKEDLMSPHVTKIVRRLPNGNLYITPKPTTKSTNNNDGSSPKESSSKKQHQQQQFQQSESTFTTEATEQQELPSKLPLMDNSSSAQTHHRTDRRTSAGTKKTTNRRRRRSSVEETAAPERRRRSSGSHVAKKQSSPVPELMPATTTTADQTPDPTTMHDVSDTTFNLASVRQTIQNANTDTPASFVSPRRTSRAAGTGVAATPRQRRRRKSGSHLPATSQPVTVGEADSVQLASCPRTTGRTRPKPRTRRRRASSIGHAITTTTTTTAPDSKELPDNLPLTSTGSVEAEEQEERPKMLKKKARRRNSTSSIPDAGAALDAMEQQQAGHSSAGKMSSTSNNKRTSMSTSSKRRSTERKASKRNVMKQEPEEEKVNPPPESSSSVRKAGRRMSKEKRGIVEPTDESTSTSTPLSPLRRSNSTTQFVSQSQHYPPRPPSTRSKAKRRTSFAGDGTDFSDNDANSTFISPNVLKQRLQIPTQSPPHSAAEATEPMEEHTSHTFATEMTPLDQQSSHSFANELTSDDFQHNNNNNNNVPKRKAKSISPATNKKESVEPPARTRSHVDIFQSHFVVASGGGSGHGSGSGHGGKKYRSSPKSARKRPVMEPEGTKAHDTNDEGEFRPSVKPTVSAVSSDSASAATSTSLPQPWKELLKTTKQRAQSMGDVVSSNNNNNYNHNHASYDFSAGTPSEDLASTESLELEPSPTSVLEEPPTKGVFSLDFTNQQQDVEPHVLTKQQKQQGTSDVQAYHESIQWKSLAVPHPLQSSGRRAQRRMTLTCDGRDNLDSGTNTDRRAKTVAPPGNDGNILSPRGAASRDSDVDAERQKLISPAASNDDASEADLDLSDMVLTQAESEIEAAQLPSVTTIVQHLSASASLIDATDIPYKTTLNSFAAERSVDTDDETLLTRSESGEEDSANNELPKQGSAITQHFASTTKSKKSLSDACDSVVLSKALKVVPSLHSSEVDDTDNQTALPSLHSIQQNEVEEDSVVSELPTATTISQHLAAKSPRSQRKGISDACDSVVLSKALQKKPLSKSLQPDDVDNDTVLPSLYSIQESQAGTVSTESLAEERTRTTATESTTISQHLSSTSPKKSKKVLSDACDSVVLSKTLQNRPLGRVMQRDEPDNDTVLPSLYSVQPSGTEDEEEDEENSVLTELPTASSISQHISATSTGKFRKKGLSDACDSVVLSKALKNKPLGRAFQPDEIDNDTVLPSLYSIQQSDPDDEDDDESDESMVSELPKNARLKQHFAAKSAKHRNKKGLSDACDSVVLSKALKTKPLTRTLHPDEQDNDTVLPSLYSVQPSDTDDSDEDEGDESVVSELPKNTRLKQHFAAKSPKQRNKKGLSDACDSVVLSKALQKKPLMKSIQAEEYDNDTVLPSLYSVETREVDEGGSVASSYVLEPTRKGHTSNSLLNASGKFRALEERKGQAITNAYAMDDLMMNTSTLLKDDSGAGDKDGSIRRRSLDVLSSYNKASSYSGNKANLSALDLSPQKPKKTLSYQSHFSNAAPPLTGTDQTRSANLDEDDEIVSVDGSLEDHGEGAPSPIRRYHSMQPGSSAHRRNDLWLYKNNGNNNDERKVTRRHSYGTSTGHSRATLESLDNSESVVGELPERGKLQLVKSSDSVELTFVRKKKSAQKSAQQKRQRSARRLKPWTSTSNLDASMDLNFLHQSVPTHGPSPWEHFTSGGENAEEDHLTRSQRLDRWSTSY